jgi:hypothetical protein
MELRPLPPAAPPYRILDSVAAVFVFPCAIGATGISLFSLAARTCVM